MGTYFVLIVIFIVSVGLMRNYPIFLAPFFFFSFSILFIGNNAVFLTLLLLACISYIFACKLSNTHRSAWMIRLNMIETMFPNWLDFPIIKNFLLKEIIQLKPSSCSTAYTSAGIFLHLEEKRQECENNLKMFYERLQERGENDFTRLKEAELKDKLKKATENLNFI